MQLRFPCQHGNWCVLQQRDDVNFEGLYTRKRYPNGDLIIFKKKLLYVQKNYTDKKIHVWCRPFSFLCEMSVKLHSYVQEYELNEIVN